MNITNIIILIVLGILSYIDIKFKEIPSIFLTGLVFFILFFRFDNLQFGLLAFVLAYILYEGEFITGIGDIKVITLVGFMINSMFFFGIFVLILMILGISTKFILYNKFKNNYQFAFIPIIFLTYLILLLFGGVI